MSDQIQELKEVLQKGLDSVRDQTQQTIDKALQETKTLGTLTQKTAEELKELGNTTTDLQAEMKARLLDLEQKLAARGEPQRAEAKSLGQLVTESEEFKAAASLGSRAKGMDAVQVGSFHKTAIVNATGLNQPLVQDQRLQGIITPAERALTVRNLLPVGTTTSSMISYAKELVFTNNAGPQYSSPNRENVAKPESGITFELANTAVVTLAHWIPASRQVLEDAGMLAGYINNRLMYGLKLEEEDEILNGVGTGGTLDGLMNNATAYNRHVTGDQKLDTLLRAMLQVSLSEYMADGIMLNPIDWADIQLLKSTTGEYIFADPASATTPQAWGRPVVPTNSMTSGDFLVGAFQLGAQIWDREQSTIRVAEQHSDFFVKNMVAILAEERLALAIYRPLSFVKGTF